MIYAFAGCVAGGLAAGVGALTLPEKPVVGGAGLICGVTAVYVMLRGADPLIYVGQVVVPTAALAGLLAFASLASSASGGQWFSLLQAVGGPAAAACYLLEPRFLRWLSNRRQRVQAREAERDLLVVRRVDDLLVKVQAQGLDGLTRAELAFLRRASRRYRDRILPVASSPPVQQQENTR
jgi:hypothetical protein